MAEPPAWLESLIESVADCMEAHSALGPFGFRWGNEEDQWHIIVYPLPGELVGGAEDGSIVRPGFSLDVQELSAAFEELAGIAWEAGASGSEDHDGPFISFEGVYDGHGVFLQVLSEAPDDVEPGFKIELAGDDEDTSGGT